jgi:malonyl-CoA O-methyltransferase
VSRRVLPASAAYRLWAATYDIENPVTLVEQRAVEALTPALQGAWLLDAACGTGRRLPAIGGSGPERVFGIDLVHEMICAGLPERMPGTVSAHLSVGDVRALPYRSGLFHVIWCRLAIGHLPELKPVYCELARVARAGAAIIITDFHPAAARAGHTRSFRDRAGTLHTVENFAHDVDAHLTAAQHAGLSLTGHLEPVIGPEVRPFYEKAGKLDAFSQQAQLPLVLALAFRA